MRLVLACGVVVALASPARAESTKPADRAAKLLATQVPQIESHDAALVDTFAPDAVIFAPRALVAHADNADILDAIRLTSPHETIKKVTLGKVIAGGDDTIVWLVTDFSIRLWNAEPETPGAWETHAERVVELMTADAGWKVVAASFSEPAATFATSGDPSALPATTDAGTLTPLLANPAALDAALAKSGPVAVLGTDKGERGLGAADAHALLAKWKKLDLSIVGKPREVHGKTWAFALANVRLKLPSAKDGEAMTGLVIAVPVADGTWAVVAACYAAI